MVQKSRRWLWTGVILIGLGLAGGLFFGYQVFHNKVSAIVGALSISDTQVLNFQRLDCPWALSPGETGVVTVILPDRGMHFSKSIKATGTGLDVNLITPQTSYSLEIKWEITAQGGGNGLLLVEGPTESNPSINELNLYWSSMYRQACGVLMTVLGIPYKLYVALCLLFAIAGGGAFTRWRIGPKKKP